MHYSSVTRIGVRNALLSALYDALVVTFMQNANRMFGAQDTPYLTGFMVLTLFVVSALITGSLILWTPANLLADGKKQEAGAMLFASGITLVILLVIVAAIALLVK